MTATNNLISRLDSFSQPKIFVLTLDESEASIMVVACETIRHRLESIARANKMDSSISSEERQTIKHACHVVANLTVKLRGFRKAGKLGSLVRNLDMKWRTARRALSPLPAKHRESDMSDDLKPCPGCASRNLFDGPTAIGNPERYVRCYQCGMSGAFTAWNRRASDAEIERLRVAAPLYQEALQRADLLIRTLPRKWWRAPNVGVKAVAAIKELIDLAGRRRGCYGRN